MKKALVLGAGMVASPLIEYLLNNNVETWVASLEFTEKIDKILKNSPNAKKISWSVEQTDALKDLVKSCDIVISLLPYVFHVSVAKICIEFKKSLVTTSYVKPEMKELEAQAKKANIILLNEVGLDPGIDHMSAMKMIHAVQAKKGNVVSFSSICGALPAVEASQNPFRYKFSWSPMGVAMAAKNNARYKKEGKIIEIAGENLFRHYYTTEIPGIGTMEVYPNRDSIEYLATYSIPQASSIFRGTIRYPEWCDLWYAISNLGLLSSEEKKFPDNATYKDFVESLLGTSQIKEEIKKKINLRDDKIIDKLEWLGLFSQEKIQAKRPIDLLVAKLLEKLQYTSDERDMVVLQDEVIAEYENQKIKHVSTLIAYGIPGQNSAVSRTVALPAACAVRMILEGKIRETGVHIPVLSSIYDPILKELATLGIQSTESEEICKK